MIILNIVNKVNASSTVSIIVVSRFSLKIVFSILLIIIAVIIGIMSISSKPGIIIGPIVTIGVMKLSVAYLMALFIMVSVLLIVFAMLISLIESMIPSTNVIVITKNKNQSINLKLINSVNLIFWLKI